MKNWIFAIVITLLGLLQITFLDYFKIFNIKPDLLLISMVIVSLRLDLRWALFLSILAGIFKDVSGVNMFGINTLLFPVWSLAIKKISRQITIEHNLLGMSLVFMVSLIHNIITGIILICLGKSIALGIFLRILAIESIYTAAVSLLILELFNLL